MESHLKWKCLSWDSVRHLCLRWSQLKITIIQEAVFCCLHCQANRFFNFKIWDGTVGYSDGCCWRQRVEGRLCAINQGRGEKLFYASQDGNWQLLGYDKSFLPFLRKDLCTFSHNIASQELQQWHKSKEKEKHIHALTESKPIVIRHNNIPTSLNWLLCSRILHGNR